MATVRLFDDAAYCKEATARVLSCEKVTYKENECYACVLDQTLFFPEEGGQSADKGTINGISVIDVQEKDHIIYHYVPSMIEESINVKLCLDWEYRFSNMQQHSGEHIFSGLVHTHFGYDNVGFHLSDNTVTMDFDGSLSDDDIAFVERKVNEVIATNVTIVAEYVDDETLKSLEYRSKKELDGPIRIVTIEDCDVCACCAPHVARTGEIGMLKVIHSANYKGGVRIQFLCGFRALEYFRDSLGLLDTLTNVMSTGREKLVSNVNKLKEENLVLSSELMNAKQSLLNLEFASIPKEQRDVVIFKEKMDLAIVRKFVNSLVLEHSGIISFFTGSDDDGYSYVIASKEEDTHTLQNMLSETLGAKGGGKKEMVCGSVQATRDSIETLLCVG